MKVALAGVGHWHTPFYLEPLLQQPGVQVVGVTDSDAEVARRFGERLGCAFGADFPALCAREKPDLAFVLGRHSEMAANARFLIAEKIPFAIEKPAGVSAAEVRDLAAMAARSGAWCSVALVFRMSGFRAAIAEHARDERVLYADFKFIAGLPSRYREANCTWMYDRRQTGGGTLVNLGVHFIDLFQQLCGTPEAQVSGAQFANLNSEGDVEDYASVLLRHGGRMGRVETGYLYPAPTGAFDLHFSVRTERHYFRSTGPGLVEVSDLSGHRRDIEATTTNIPIYPLYVGDVIRQVNQGAPPLADLGELADVMALVESAYQIGGDMAVTGRE